MQLINFWASKLKRERIYDTLLNKSVPRNLNRTAFDKIKSSMIWNSWLRKRDHPCNHMSDFPSFWYSNKYLLPREKTALTQAFSGMRPGTLRCPGYPLLSESAWNSSHWWSMYHRSQPTGSHVPCPWYSVSVTAFFFMFLLDILVLARSRSSSLYPSLSETASLLPAGCLPTVPGLTAWPLNLCESPLPDLKLGLDQRSMCVICPSCLLAWSSSEPSFRPISCQHAWTYNLELHLAILTLPLRTQ